MLQYYFALWSSILKIFISQHLLYLEQGNKIRTLCFVQKGKKATKFTLKSSNKKQNQIKCLQQQIVLPAYSLAYILSQSITKNYLKLICVWKRIVTNVLFLLFFHSLSFYFYI
ncbi:hypothetical protein AAZX31_11G180600 [Glycine max]